jgi:hypothetical protein
VGEGESRRERKCGESGAMWCGGAREGSGGWRMEYGAWDTRSESEGGKKLAASRSAVYENITRGGTCGMVFKASCPSSSCGLAMRRQISVGGGRLLQSRWERCSQACPGWITPPLQIPSSEYNQVRDSTLSICIVAPSQSQVEDRRRYRL